MMSSAKGKKVRRMATAIRNLSLLGAATIVVAVILAATFGKVLPGAGSTPSHPLTGSQDDRPPVVEGGFKSWAGTVAFGEVNGWYQACFEQVTGHPWQDAKVSAAKEAEGWAVKVALVSNADIPSNPGLPVFVTSGFTNTEGIPADRCHPFGDQRSQVREALAFPGPTREIPGLPAVLLFCGNPVAFPPAGVPVPQATTPSTPTPTPTQPTTGGKDATKDVLTGPVPEQVKGCGAAGCGGNTAGEPYQPPPAPPPAPPALPPATTAPRPVPTYTNPIPTTGPGTGP
ncbi:MAG: hypothetical protein Q8R28_24125 [Dehalococcoidia bacterium]|nr:hypothetical protein [Dehalococcoidia bacterium]